MKYLKAAWRLFSQIAGESDYSRYCAHLRARHPEAAVPTEREFFLKRLEDKYAKPSRCC